MRVLILAAGRFGQEMRSAISAGQEPRLDVFELGTALGADVNDFLELDGSRDPAVIAITRAFGESAGLGYLGFRKRNEYDAILSSGEDIGIPLSLALETSRAKCSHTMIAHTLTPLKKRVFFQFLGVGSRMDRILAYSSSEERHMIDRLGIPAPKVQRIFYHADQDFFRPTSEPIERRLICAAGQLLRDYDCLIDAVRGLDIEVDIAAGSPWIDDPLRPSRPLPSNIKWRKRSRYELRQMYARAALAVVPILENDYQTGIATILEMMAMGKCVIATRTRGQTDTIVDGETGTYVPPSNPGALQAAIQRLLGNPEEAARLGRNARRFIEQHASLDHFVERVAGAVRAAHELRRGASET